MQPNYDPHMQPHYDPHHGHHRKSSSSSHGGHHHHHNPHHDQKHFKKLSKKASIIFCLVSLICIGIFLTIVFVMKNKFDEDTKRMSSGWNLSSNFLQSSE